MDAVRRSVTRNINVQNLACVFQVACVSGGGCKAQRTTISVHLLVCVCVSLEAINVQSLAYMFQSKRINQSAQLGEIMWFPLGTSVSTEVHTSLCECLCLISNKQGSLPGVNVSECEKHIVCTAWWVSEKHQCAQPDMCLFIE